MNKIMDCLVVDFMRESVKSHHHKERGEILTALYCAEIAKAECEAERPNKEHMWDLTIKHYKQQLEDLNGKYQESLNFLKSLETY